MKVTYNRELVVQLHPTDMSKTIRFSANGVAGVHVFLGSNDVGFLTWNDFRELVEKLEKFQ